MKKTNDTNITDGLHRKKRNPWLTVLKVFCWCLGILIVLAGIAVWIISAQFTPEKITNLIEEKSNEYLDAEIKIGKLDYRLFRTYPWFDFEIDSLTVLSKSLEGLPSTVRDSLPKDADFLASVVKLKGEINVHDLMHEDINIRNLQIVNPKVNIVVVNDSINNFNIAKKLPTMKKKPEVQISRVNLISPFDFKYFSLIPDIVGQVRIDSFFLEDKIEGNGSKKQNFKLGVEGVVDGRYGEYELPSNLPVKFNSDIHFDLPSYSISLSNLYLALAGLSLEARGEINADRNGIDIQKADFNIKVDDIFTLLKYLPQGLMELIPIPEGLTGILPLDLSFTLLYPYHFSPSDFNEINLEKLPSLHAEATTLDASIEYIPPKGKKVTADDVYFKLACEFMPSNPESTFVKINDFRMKGEGVSLEGNLEVDNLLGKEQNIEGSIIFQSPIMETLSYLLPKSGLKIAGLLKGKVDFTGTSLNLGKDGCKNLNISGDIASHSLKVNSGKTGYFDFKNLKSDYKAIIPSYPLDNNYAGTKIAFDLLADSIHARSQDLNLSLSSIDFQLDAMDTVSGSPDPFGDFELNIGGLKLNYSGNSFTGSDIDIKAKGNLNSNGSNNNFTTVNAPSPGEDQIIASRVQHTPLVVEYNGGGILQTAMTLLSLQADMKMGKGNFKTPDYLYPVEISRLKITTDLNDVQFSSSEVQISNTSFSISGKASGIGTFMTSYSATPIGISSDIDFENVDINKLSWGYYGALIAKGENKDSVFSVTPMLPYTAADSLCVIIPRNINADIRLRSKSAEYMQYIFSPLSTGIIVKDGVATLDKLTIGAPYCTAVVDWTYSTKDLADIFMNLNAEVKNFTFTPFYKVFPAMIDKAPELKDFTGVINANIDCNFKMFPSMFMNGESLKGSFDIKGTELEFARQGKIEKITHLMLIEGNSPIHIENIDIRGDFHDGLLQLNPFKIRFDEYQLSLAGVNNTGGDMYYHIALEKSPFHLPFGVTLSGKFQHPDINVGGTHINDYKAEKVSMDPVTNINVNIMTYLRHGWNLFIQEAAKYEGGM